MSSSKLVVHDDNFYDCYYIIYLVAPFLLDPFDQLFYPASIYERRQFTSESIGFIATFIAAVTGFPDTTCLTGIF